MDLTPHEDFDDALEDKKAKKFGLLLKNKTSKNNFLICLKFANKKMVIKGTIDEVYQPTERIFMDFVISTIILVLSSVNREIN